jgi:hypothetical protein
MTPSRDVDELASALIDGALGPDEAAAARRDPAVATRAAEMQAAREAVRLVPPPDPGRLDATIAAALASAGPTAAEPGGPWAVVDDPAAAGGLDAPAPSPTTGPATGTPPAPTPPPPDPVRMPARPPEGRGGSMVPMGPRRRRWTDPRWLGAAAAVVLVLAVGGVLAAQSSPSDDNGDQTASADMESAPSTSGSESGSDAGGGGGTEEGRTEGDGDSSSAAPNEAAPGAAPDQSTSGSAGGVVDLGSADSGDDLAERAARALADGTADQRGNEGQSSDEGSLSASSGCLDPLATESGPLLLEARATLEGRDVYVWVHDDGPSRRMVAVSTDVLCTVLVDRLVPG